MSKPQSDVIKHPFGYRISGTGVRRLTVIMAMNSRTKSPLWKQKDYKLGATNPIILHVLIPWSYLVAELRLQDSLGLLWTRCVSNPELRAHPGDASHTKKME